MEQKYNISLLIVVLIVVTSMTMSVESIKSNKFDSEKPLASISKNVFIIKSDGTFFGSNGQIDAYAVLRNFYKYVKDDYDYVAIVTAWRNSQGVDTAGIVKNDILGIGLPLYDNAPLFGLPTKKLRGFTVTNDIDKYIEQYTKVKPLFFEFSHFWLIYLGDAEDCKGISSENPRCATGLKINSVYYGHWSRFVDTSTKSRKKTYIDPSGGSIWNNNGDGTFTYLGTTASSINDPFRYTDLSLYLMGFLPPQNVKPITLFVPSQDENIPDSFSTEDIGKKFR